MNKTLEVSSYISHGKGVLESQVDVDFQLDKHAMAETEESRDMINTIWNKKIARRTTGSKGCQFL